LKAPWKGSVVSYRTGLTLGRALDDRNIERWYAFLAERLFDTTGSETMGRYDHTGFTTQHLACYRDEDKDLNMYTEDMLQAAFQPGGEGFTIPPELERISFVAKERILLHGDRRDARLVDLEAAWTMLDTGSAPLITVRPRPDWLNEYRWSEHDSRLLTEGPRDVALLLVPAVAPGEAVPACLVPADSEQLAQLIARARPAADLAVSARYLAPAVAAEFPLDENSPVVHLRDSISEAGGRNVVIIDIELNIAATIWALGEQSMSVDWRPLPLPAGAVALPELAILLARSEQGSQLFVGVCRRERAKQLVEDILGMFGKLLSWGRTAAPADVATALAIATNLVQTRSYVGMAPVEETPL
jgi:hypothetical protein